MLQAGTNRHIQKLFFFFFQLNSHLQIKYLSYNLDLTVVKHGKQLVCVKVKRAIMKNLIQIFAYLKNGKNNSKESWINKNSSGGEILVISKTFQMPCFISHYLF